MHRNNIFNLFQQMYIKSRILLVTWKANSNSFMQPGKFVDNITEHLMVRSRMTGSLVELSPEIDLLSTSHFSSLLLFTFWLLSLLPRCWGSSVNMLNIRKRMIGLFGSYTGLQSLWSEERLIWLITLVSFSLRWKKRIENHVREPFYNLIAWKGARQR